MNEEHTRYITVQVHLAIKGGHHEIISMLMLYNARIAAVNQALHRRTVDDADIDQRLTDRYCKLSMCYHIGNDVVYHDVIVNICLYLK